MAIINNRNKPAEEEKPAESIITPPHPPLPPPDPISERGGKGEGFPVKMLAYVGVGVVVLLLVVTGTMYVPDMMNTTTKPQVDPKVVSLEVERMVRIGGLMSLLEKKIAHTEVSLKKSEKLGDKVLIDTMRLGLARNLEDLNKHREEFIAGLIKLHSFYVSNPEMITSFMKKSLKESEDIYKAGNVKTITAILQLLENVPEKSKPVDYFREVLKT